MHTDIPAYGLHHTLTLTGPYAHVCWIQYTCKAQPVSHRHGVSAHGRQRPGDLAPGLQRLKEDGRLHLVLSTMSMDAGIAMLS